MGTRFLAALGATVLVASGAFVGLGMASGTWSVLGKGLEPGSAYALQLNDADRIRLELADATGDPSASFAVWGPAGKAGYFALDASTKGAEVAAGKGIWMVMVYKAQGGDLRISTHGAEGTSHMLPAEVTRNEIVLGDVESTQAVDMLYSATVKAEPALAGVYLDGSARSFVSELKSDKGTVETVTESEVSSVSGGMVVDSSGSRASNPANLAAGGYQAHIKAASLSGKILLVTLTIKAPNFVSDAPTPPEPPTPPGAGDHKDKKKDKSKDKGNHTQPSHPGKPPKHDKGNATISDDGFADCGVMGSGSAASISAPRGELRFTLEQRMDPSVSIYDPTDNLAGIVVLKKQGDTDSFTLPGAGDYVLYARGGGIHVELKGDSCDLTKIRTHTQKLTTIVDGSGLGGIDPLGFDPLGSGTPWGGNQSSNDTAKNGTGNDTAKANDGLSFRTELPPLELGVRFASPDGAALGLEAIFTGPLGAAVHQSELASTGVFSTSGPGSWDPTGASGSSGSGSSTKADRLVQGDWKVDVQAQAMHGDLEAFGVFYVRGGADEA